MENENEKKTEEKETSTNESQKEEVNSSEKGLSLNKLKSWLTQKTKGYRENVEAGWKENKKMIIFLVLAIIVVAGAYFFVSNMKKSDIGSDAVKQKVETFIKNNADDGIKAEVKEVVKEGDFYKVAMLVQGKAASFLVTRDGKNMIQSDALIDLNMVREKPAPEKTEAETKLEVPEVDLYVMSYCPYGLQMERGILPVVKTLGKNIKFNLKFVDYTLHGQKEVDENLNQYCIQKTQPAKLGAYLECFWKKSTGTADACMKTVGINSSQVKACLEETKKEFSPTEKSMGVDKEDAQKYGVKGSPTLVVNGTVVSSKRDSASVLKTICSGFTNQPKECETDLSSTAPGAGFDDQIAAAGKTDSAGGAASCGN